MLDSEIIDRLLDPDNNHFDQIYNFPNISQCNYIPISDYNRKLQNSQSDLSILNFNIRSFNANFDIFMSYFQNCLSLFHNFECYHQQYTAYSYTETYYQVNIT